MSHKKTVRITLASINCTSLVKKIAVTTEKNVFPECQNVQNKYYSFPWNYKFIILLRTQKYTKHVVIKNIIIKISLLSVF